MSLVDNLLHSNNFFFSQKGSRKCFGELLAMDSLYTFVATLVANFKFDSIPGQEPSLENCNFSFILAPDAFNVKVTKLSI